MLWMMSLPVWGEWIEIQASRALMKASESLPVWGEWIEIGKRQLARRNHPVSPRVGRVD